jgi:hypothetical protein
MGVSLPDDYRAFLKRSNGGSLCHANADPQSGFGIWYFYGIRVGLPGFDLEYMNAINPDEAEDGLLEIAVSRFNDTLCLSTRPSDFGQVYVRDHYQLDPDIDFGDENTYDADEESEPIASCLSELLSRLELQVSPLSSDDVDTTSTPSLVRAAFDSIHSHESGQLLELLNQGLDPNARSNDGKTLLSFAAHQCRLPSMRVLLQHGADVDLTTASGVSTVRLGVWAGCGDCIKLLAAHGANLDAPDQKGNMPLREAIASRQLHAAAALLECGADPNKKTTDGKTYLEMVKKLYGYPVNRDNGEWLTGKLLAAGARQ